MALLGLLPSLQRHTKGLSARLKGCVKGTAVEALVVKVGEWHLDHPSTDDVANAGVCDGTGPTELGGATIESAIVGPTDAPGTSISRLLRNRS